ncbi:MAG: class I SAM-dependent methyltransferase [Pseudomonadota bacterium]
MTSRPSASAVARPLANFFWNLALDVRSVPHRLRRGAARPPLPWNVFHNVGGAEYDLVGATLLKRFQGRGLAPDHHVLDIGCGTGRVAAPLQGFLGPDARYIGFDVSARAVRWCGRHLEPRRSGFSFHHADIYNAEYNRGGSVAGDAYSFPCADGSVDFAFATSVFTHMQTAEVSHYIKEIARALRPGGFGCASFFILNDEARAAMADGRADAVFVEGQNGAFVVSHAAPGQAVAYEEAQLKDLLSGAGLTVDAPVEYGAWTGRKGAAGRQDFIWFRKPGAATRGQG